MMIKAVADDILEKLGKEFYELDSFGLIEFLVIFENKIREVSGCDINFVDAMSGGNFVVLDDIVQFTAIKITKKMAIVDLDNTLWEGIVGDVGWENIKPNVEIQTMLKQMKEAGMLLAICSKNEEDAALDAIEKHPDMILRMEDFVSYRINRADKPSNIKAISFETGIALDFIVFIDDELREREAVKEILPDVLVPDWPCNMQFFVGSPTEEDVKRTELYRDEFKRVRSAKKSDDYTAWLVGLEQIVTVEMVTADNEARVRQLLNKSNQMNLRTRRPSMSDPLFNTFALSVKDRFGDCGIVGILGFEGGHVRDFVLSCRVMGRGIEQAMCAVIGHYATLTQVDRIYAEYLPTNKNWPCSEFFREEGFYLDKKGYVIPALCPVMPEGIGIQYNLTKGGKSDEV